MSKTLVRARRRGPPGFTLIELLVATILSSIVLMGMFSVLTNMVTAEVNSMRNGTVTSWSLAGIGAMNTDIAGAGTLSFPASGGGADSLVVCANWSKLIGTLGGAPQGSGPTKVYNYCWDSTDAPPFRNALLRNVRSYPPGPAVCPSAPLSPCTAGIYGGDSVVATGVYKDAANDPIFYADPNTMNAVRLRLVIGNPAANAASAGGNGGTVNAVPVSVPFNTEIILED